MQNIEKLEVFEVKSYGHNGRMYFIGCSEEKNACKTCGSAEGNYISKKLTLNKEIMGSSEYNLEECSKCKSFSIYCCSRHEIITSKTEYFFDIFKYFFMDEFNNILGASGVIDFTNEQIKLLEMNGIYNRSFIEN